jgi:hypothetical protein
VDGLTVQDEYEQFLAFEAAAFLQRGDQLLVVEMTAAEAPSHGEGCGARRASWFLCIGEGHIGFWFEG